MPRFSARSATPGIKVDAMNPAQNAVIRQAATVIGGLLLVLALASCGIINTSSPLPSTTAAYASAAASLSAAPDLVGSWKTPPMSFTGVLPLQALALDISAQSVGGALTGTMLYYGDGIISPTETVAVSGNIDSFTIRLSGLGGSLTGTYSLTASASISFTAVVQTASGTQNLAGVLYST